MGLVIFSMAFLVVITLIYTLSSVARYYMKWIIFGFTSVAAATLPMPLMFLNPRDPKNALIPAAALRASSNFLGISLKVEGHENIVQNSGCVVLINHQSFLDLVVLACLWPIMDNCTVISKIEILYMPFFGLASWLWGTIFISRGSANAQEAVNKTGAIIKKRKARVLMFPEGTRNLGNKRLLPFKKGGFHLALASEVPIQPVAVGRFNFLKHLSFESGEIIIKILPQITTKGRELNEIMDETYKVLSENVDLISKSE